MTYRARVEYDWQVLGIKATIGDSWPDSTTLLLWPNMPERIRVAAENSKPQIPEGQSEHLRLPEEAARALYEALGEYFGGTGHDTRALRTDYDDERKRVDRLVGMLEKRQVIVVNGSQIDAA